MYRQQKQNKNNTTPNVNEIMCNLGDWVVFHKAVSKDDYRTASFGLFNSSYDADDL